MATQQLKVFINNFVRQVEAKSSSKDPIRGFLNNRLQGFIVNERVILKELKRPVSPYAIQISEGLVDETDLVRYSKLISRDWFKELLRTGSGMGIKVYKLNGDKFPNEFLTGKGAAIAFNRSKRIVYWRGVTEGSDMYESFRASIIQPTIDRVRNSYDVMSPLRVYVSPDQKYMDEVNKVDAESNKQLSAKGSPTTGKAAQSFRARELSLIHI